MQLTTDSKKAEARKMGREPAPAPLTDEEEMVNWKNLKIQKEK